MKMFRAIIFILFFCILQGCTKHADKSGGSEQKATPDSGSQEPGVSAFGPVNSTPLASSDLRGDLKKSYEAAAAASAAYLHSIPYERQTILNHAIPPIEGVLKLNADNLRHDPNAENVATLMRLDYRFAGLVLRNEINTAISQNSINPEKPRQFKITIDDPGGIPQAEPPSVSSGPPASVSRVGPDSVTRGINQLGNTMVNASREMNLDAALQKEIERLLMPALAKGADYQKLFSLMTSDSIETRAAKLALKSAFDDFLGAIVTYKGSYFLGMQMANGTVQIWEFKQPVIITASHNEPDEKTRLNMGIELVAQLHFSAGGSDSWQRCYSGGWWTTWTNFPEIGPISLTKAKGWTITRSATFRGRRSFRLTIAELDMALARSETTKLVGQAEASTQGAEGDTSSVDYLMTLLESAAMHGDLDAANVFGDRLTRIKELPSSTAKQTAGILADVFYQRTPQMASDFYKGDLFDNGATRGAGGISERQQRTPFDDNSEKPSIPPFPDAELSQLSAVYSTITQAEPNNTDASFDLALIYVLRGFRDGNTKMLGNSAAALFAAAVTNTKPSSGRNFHEIATDSTTFLPLARCRDSQVESFVGAVLNPSNLESRFGQAYQTYGY